MLSKSLLTSTQSADNGYTHILRVGRSGSDYGYIGDVGSITPNFFFNPPYEDGYNLFTGCYWTPFYDFDGGANVIVLTFTNVSEMKWDSLWFGVPSTAFIAQARFAGMGSFWVKSSNLFQNSVGKDVPIWVSYDRPSWA